MTTPKDEAYPARSRYQGSFAQDYLAGRVHDPRWEREQEAIEGFLRKCAPGSTVVDVPFGTGRFVDFYAQCELVVYGLDVSRDMMDQARSTARELNARLEPVLGEIEFLPVRDRSIDHVVCVRFLNWVQLPVVDRILGEFARVARKDVLVHVRVRKPLGSAALLRTLGHEAVTQTIPLLRRFVGYTRQSLVGALRRLAGRAAPDETYGYALHDADALDAVIRRHGFEIVDTVLIESETAYSRSQIEPLYVFVLRPAGTDG